MMSVFKVKQSVAAALWAAATMLSPSCVANKYSKSMENPIFVSSILSECTTEGVYSSNGVTCLNGSITMETASSLKKLANPEGIVIINSSGGAATEAMKIAEVLNDDFAEVVFTERCWSSCFNYILPAFDSAYLVKGTSLFGHGWLPYNMEDPAKLFCKPLFRSKGYNDCLTDINSAMKEQEKFFQKFPVSLKLRNDFTNFYLNRPKPKQCHGSVRCDNRMYLNESNYKTYLPDFIWVNSNRAMDNRDICSDNGVFIAKQKQNCIVIE